MGKHYNSIGSSFDLIITTYNRRELVARAVDSALAQECPGLTVTVVDDGGEDGTTEFLRKRYGDRITVLRKENGGLSSARNHGVANTNGEFIAFLDDDDELLPGKLARQREILLREPESGFCFSAGYMQKSWRGGRELIALEQPRTGTLGEQLRNNFGPPHAYAVRRALAKEVGGFDESLTSVEDWDFWLRCATLSECEYDHLPGYVYHLDDGNMSRDHENMLHHYLLVYDRHVGAWDGPDRVKRDYRARHLVKFVRRFFDAKEPGRATEVFRDALAESPLAVRLVPRPYLRELLADDGPWFSKEAPALARADGYGVLAGSGHLARAGLRQLLFRDWIGARRLLVAAVRTLTRI